MKDSVKAFLDRRIRHAVSEVEDHDGEKREVEDATTLMESLTVNPFGDLIVASDDYVDHASLIAEIKAAQSEDE